MTGYKCSTLISLQFTFHESPDKLQLIKFTYCDQFQRLCCNFPILYFPIHYFPIFHFPIIYFLILYFSILYLCILYSTTYTLFPYTLFPYTLFSYTLYPYTLLQLQIKKGMSYLVLLSLTFHFTCRSV